MTELPMDDPSQALVRERLRLHAFDVLPAAFVTLLAGALLAVLCMRSAGATALAGWWLVLALVQGLRVALAWSQARRAAPAAADWLLRHRVLHGLHGAWWGLLSLLVMPSGGHGVTEVVAFGVVGVAGGVMVTSAFDPRAAAAFALPALLPLVVGLVQAGESGLVGVALFFIGAMALAARRAARLFVAQIESTQAEARRAQEARRSAEDAEHARRELADQHALLRQLIDGTSQGYWFVGPDATTLDVNAAMCTLLGRPREEVLRLTVLDCFSGPEREVLARQLALRRSGHRGGYEVDIVRPDGSRVHAYNNATPIYRADGSLMGSIGLWTDLTPHKRMESELRTYERVTQSIADMVSVVDIDRRLVLVNDAWCRSTGLTRAQALGAPVALHPLQIDPADPTGAVDRCFATGELQAFTTDATLADGRQARLLTHCFPYRAQDDDVDVRAVILVTRDITEQHLALERLRHREAELRALFEAFPGYIGAVDEDMRYVFVNRRTAALLGHPGQDLLGLPVEQVLGPAHARRGREEMARAAAGEILLLERELAPRGDRPGMIVEVTHLAGPPGPDGRRVYYSFGLDVTARKRALEDLARARDDAERANRAKSRFLSHMSHELRTPLNAITGFAQLLERDRRTALAPRQRGWVAQILRGGQHLSQLIGEVLDLARIEAGQLTLEPTAVPLDELADECLSFVAGLARGRGVRVRRADAAGGGLNDAVRADRTRLKQVLLNLLSNAIKYNRPGGEVQIGADRADTFVRLWVRDTGPGLSASQQERLFQPFERLGAERGTIEGSGIGLLVSRQLVEAMGGRIGVDSVPGRGSTFWVELPLAERHAAPDFQLSRPVVVDAEPVAIASGGPVLCVDDNPVNLMLLEAMLHEACGLDAVAVGAPADAMGEALRLRPRLVLLDIHMPGLSGYDVLNQLRADPETAAVPVVAVSADAHAHEIETALAAGFDDYLTKPIELDALRGVLGRLLGAPVVAES